MAYSPPKTSFRNENDARFAMVRIWSHDPRADINDLHVYPCTYGGIVHFHVGHKSYYEKAKQKEIQA